MKHRISIVGLGLIGLAFAMVSSACAYRGSADVRYVDRYYRTWHDPYGSYSYYPVWYKRHDHLKRHKPFSAYPHWRHRHPGELKRLYQHRDFPYHRLRKHDRHGFDRPVIKKHFNRRSYPDFRRDLLRPHKGKHFHRHFDRK
ncbi:MAG: hypothetical protein ACOWWM_18180 [Desulfobacterales bacterium]